MCSVSIICPIYNEEKYIKKCIDSVLAQDYPQTDLEVLFIDGMSQDSTRKIILSEAKLHTHIHLIDNPHRVVPQALNIGIQKAEGDIIVRIDAHASFPSNYISTLVHHLQTLPNAQNVGAPCITKTLGKTDKAKAIVAILSNKFGVGNSTFRLGVTNVQKVDTVPFGCWKKETLKNIGMFNTKLIRNQDIELNKRILKSGGNIYLVPDTHCIYYARETFKALATNNYGNGKWNILTLYYTRELRSLSIRHFVPLIFVLSLLIPTVGILINPYIGLLALISLISYFVLISYVCIQLVRKQSLKFWTCLICFVVLHLSYGTGSLIGILTLPFIKK